MLYFAILRYIMVLTCVYCCFYVICVNFEYISTYKFLYKYTRVLLTDSLAYIYILSSAQYTVILYFILMMYIYTSNKLFVYNFKHDVGFVILFLLLYFYFVNWFYLHTYVNFKLKQRPTNLSLQNGLLNFHPFYIYYLYGATTVLLISNYLKAALRFYVKLNILKDWFIYVLWSIFLGSLWAAQEFNWGSFWSWDPVEIISLMLLFYISVQYHYRHRYFSIQQSLFKIICSYMIVYFIIRLGLLTSIHSFILNSKLLNNLSWLVLVSILVNILVLLKKLQRRPIFKYISANVDFYRGFKKYAFNSALLNLTIGLLTASIIVLVSPKFLLFFNAFNIKLQKVILYVVIFYLLSIFFKNFKLTRQVIYHYIALLFLINVIVFYSWAGVMFITYTPIIVVFLVYNRYKIQYKLLHIILLFFYLLFIVFFLNINIYFNKHLTGVYSVVLNKNYYVLTNGCFYEISMSLKKNFFFEKLKNIYKHIHGFSIYNNFFVALYVLYKGCFVSLLYGHIYLYIVVYLYILMIGILIFYKGETSNYFLVCY